VADALRAGAALEALHRTLNVGAPPSVIEPLPPRPEAAAFEALRDRTDRHLEATGRRPSIFLANLGAAEDFQYIF